MKALALAAALAALSAPAIAATTTTLPGGLVQISGNATNVKDSRCPDASSCVMVPWDWTATYALESGGSFDLNSILVNLSPAEWTQLNVGTDKTDTPVRFTGLGIRQLDFTSLPNADAFKGISFVSLRTRYGVAFLNRADIAVAPVPLPAAGLMLVAGLGGLAALRRRRA